MLGLLTPSLAPSFPTSAHPQVPSPPEQVGVDLGHGQTEEELPSWAPLPGKAVLHYRQGREAQRGQVTPETYRQHMANLDPKSTSHQCQSHGLSRWLPPGGAGTSSSVLGGHQAPAQGHRSQFYVEKGHNNAHHTQ